MNYIKSINGNINPLKIKDLNIKLERRNLIIIGANGAGKTRFLSFFNKCLERHDVYKALLHKGLKD